MTPSTASPPEPVRSSADVVVVVGTRPEIIKCAPVIAALGHRAFVIHTGQHYDDELADNFFTELGIGKPDLRLEGIGGKPRATQIALMIEDLAEHFGRIKPGAVIVQGDTNTVSAAAQAANYTGTPLVHMEAGLRSYDRAMPEEINRLVTGVLADVHCAATAHNVEALRAEGVPASTIALTGNTIVEATLQAIQKTPTVTIPDDPYIVATIHRPENTDSPAALERILDALGQLPHRVILLIHPRTLAAVTRCGFEDKLERITTMSPVGHTDLLALASHARLIVSDSGGLQEECTVIKSPLLVVRRSTERPESISAGFARLVTPDLDIVDEAAAAVTQSDSLSTRPSPYGDGKTAERIAAIAICLAEGSSPADAVATVMAQPLGNSPE